MVCLFCGIFKFVNICISWLFVLDGYLVGILCINILFVFFKVFLIVLIVFGLLFLIVIMIFLGCSM